MTADYPRTITLPDGQAVEVRLMTADDRDAMLEFARSLAHEDLLFLRIDITDPAVIDEWIHNIATGLSTTLIACDARGIVGYATVHRTGRAVSVSSVSTWVLHIARAVSGGFSLHRFSILRAGWACARSWRT